MPRGEHPQGASVKAGTWLDRFRDPDGTTQSLPYLDGIRAFAVIMIFVRHAWGLSGSPLMTLDRPLPLLGEVSLAPFLTMFSSGVDLFFVLSGFLLARGFLRADFQGRPAPSLPTYYAQRILRIAPPYWITLALVVFLFTPSLIKPEAVYSERGLFVFVAHVFFGQTVFLPAFGSYGIESPFWTLTIEMIFYLSLPLMVRAFLGRRWLVGLPASLAVVLGWLYGCRYGFDGLVRFVDATSLSIGFPSEVIRFFLSHTFPAHLFHFAIGITVCNLVVRRDLAWRTSPAFRVATGERAGLVYLALGLAVVVYWLGRHGSNSLANVWIWPPNYMKAETAAAREYYFLEGLPFAVGYALILLGASVGPGWVRRALSMPALCFVGVIGYSVYLLHMPMLYHFNSLPWMAGLTQPLEHFMAMLAAAGAVVLVLSTAFFVAVERPAMAAAKRVGRQSRPSRPGAQPAPLSSLAAGELGAASVAESRKVGGA